MPGHPLRTEGGWNAQASTSGGAGPRAMMYPFVDQQSPAGASGAEGYRPSVHQRCPSDRYGGPAAAPSAGSSHLAQQQRGDSLGSGPGVGRGAGPAHSKKGLEERPTALGDASPSAVPPPTAARWALVQSRSMEHPRHPSPGTEGRDRPYIPALAAHRLMRSVTVGRHARRGAVHRLLAELGALAA
jgi:hypothetical protein